MHVGVHLKLSEYANYVVLFISLGIQGMIRGALDSQLSSNLLLNRFSLNTLCCLDQHSHMQCSNQVSSAQLVSLSSD